MSDTLAADTATARGNGLKRPMNWINGESVDSGNRTKSFDPATGKEIGTIADASHADVEAAIQVAVRTFGESDWKDNRHLGAKVLNQIANRFEARREDLIEILALENGTAKAGAPAWKQVRSWYTLATDDQMIPPQAEEFMAKRMGAGVRRVASSHAVMVSHLKKSRISSAWPPTQSQDPRIPLAFLHDVGGQLHCVASA